MKAIANFGVFLALGLACACYFPNQRVEVSSKELVGPEAILKTPAKIYLKDTTIVLFQDGFTMKDGWLEGEGVGYAAGLWEGAMKRFRIRVDDIAAVTYHRQHLGFGGGVASFILDVSSPPLIFYGIYCLVDPKACFGSCPTVYIKEGEAYRFCSELFSYSICPYMEADDLDLLLPAYVPAEHPLEIRVTNEALETHHINEMKIARVIHPRETRIYPTSDNRLAVFRRSLSPEKATNSLGTDILPLLGQSDGLCYRSPDSLIEKLRKGPAFDYLDCTLKIPSSASGAKLLLKTRNTLLSTVLFYEVVLASQGMGALSWTERMNTDPQYARLFQNIYDSFSGIEVLLDRNGLWAPAGRIHDVGPIADKSVAFVIPCRGEEELRVRLKFVPDNFFFDSLSFDYDEGPPEEYHLEPLELMTVVDHSGAEREEIPRDIEKDDDLYLTTEPGESYRFFYFPPDDPGAEYTSSLFVVSRGYYTEWLRGPWVAPRKIPGYSFRLNDFSGTFAYLADTWLSQRNDMERLFFNTRVKLRGER